MNNDPYFEPPYTKSMSNEEVKAFADQLLERERERKRERERERERERTKE